jgi:hypothetical protein
MASKQDVMMASVLERMKASFHAFRQHGMQE